MVYLMLVYLILKPLLRDSSIIRTLKYIFLYVSLYFMWVVMKRLAENIVVSVMLVTH